MVIPWRKPLRWQYGDLSIKTHDNYRPSVVTSWIGTPVLDEVLSPSDRGERSETFSLGGVGERKGVAGDFPPPGFLVTLSP